MPNPAAINEYRETHPNNSTRQAILATFDALSTGYSLQSAGSAVTSFAMDTFYDSVHESDWPYQHELIYSVAALCFIAGSFSAFHAPTQQAIGAASTTISMAYLIGMPLISTLGCLMPDLLEMDGFYGRALPAILGIAASSVVITEVYRRLIQEDEIKNEDGYQDPNESDSDLDTSPDLEDVFVDAPVFSDDSSDTESIFSESNSDSESEQHIAPPI